MYKSILIQMIVISMLVMGCSKVNDPVILQNEEDTRLHLGETLDQDEKENEIADHAPIVQEDGIVTPHSPLSITIEYLTNPQRKFSELFAYDEPFAFYQLPYNENLIRLHFNQAMDRSTVEQAFQQSLSDDLSYEFDWQDDRTLNVYLSGLPSDRIHVLRFDGIRSQLGQKLEEQVIFSFKLIEPKSFYSYAWQEGVEQLLYSPQMEINDAILLKDRNIVMIKDQIGDFFGPFYDTYLINLSDGSFIHESVDEYDQKLVELGFYEDNTVYMVYDVGLESLQEALAEEQFSVMYQGVIYSPDRSKVAIFMSDKSFNQMDHDQIYGIHLIVLDKKTQQVVYKFENIFYDKFEYDGTDAIPPERYLHYKPKNAHWFQRDEIIIEYLNEEETEMVLGKLNLSTGQMVTLATGVIDPVFSPTMPYFVARVWNEPIAHMYNLDGEIVHTFEVSKIVSPIWSNDGARIVYTNPDGETYVFDLNEETSTFIGENLHIAGWMDHLHLLIYR